MLNIETSLVLIKPDAVERNLIGNIIKIYESNNLKINNIKIISATKNMAETHYEEHKGRPYFDDLIKYITRSPIVAISIEGENAISKIRELNGNTDPSSANIGTIRQLYALNKNENSVHASDSESSAKRELSIWFPL